MLLVESMLSLSILTVLGLVLLKLSINILHPRQWGLQQSLTDAYLTYERAYAERVPFETLTTTNSPWPLFPTVSTSTVEIGQLPGGTPVSGTLIRTRTADSNNLPADGGTGTATTNPTAMKTWKIQSILTYRVGTRTYTKARATLRNQ